MQAGEPELGNDGAALLPDVLTERTDKKVERADAAKGKRLLHTSQPWEGWAERRPLVWVRNSPLRRRAAAVQTDRRRRIRNSTLPP
jgi:hypothetical protein